MDIIWTSEEGLFEQPTPFTNSEQVLPGDLVPESESSEIEWIHAPRTHALAADTHQCMPIGFSDTSVLSPMPVNVGSFGDLDISQPRGVTQSFTNAPISDWQHLEPINWAAVNSLHPQTSFLSRALEIPSMPAPLDMSGGLRSEGPSDVAASAPPVETLAKDPSLPPQTQFRHVLPSRIKAKKFRGVHPQEVWQSHKDTIKQLYLDEGKPLKDVIRIMEQRHNFKASPKMYKVRFRQWGFEKNNTEKEVSRVLLMKFQRDISGKPTQFVRHGKNVDIQKYLGRKGVTEYDLVDFETTTELAVAVRCLTPPPRPQSPAYLASPEAIRHQELLLQYVRSILHFQRGQRAFLTSTQEWHIQLPDVEEDPVHVFVDVATYYSKPGRYNDTGMLMRKLAFRTLQKRVSECSATGIIQLLLRVCEIPDPELTMSFWKFVVAASTQTKRHNPTAHLYAFLYKILHKEGICGLHVLLESSLLQLVEEAEKVLGINSEEIRNIWFPLRHKFRTQTTQRCQTLLESIQHECQTSEASSVTETIAAIRLMVLKTSLLRAINPCSDEALVDLGQLESAVTRCQYLTNRSRALLLIYCTYNIHRTHLRRGWDDPAKYNPRIELAVYYLEQSIKYRLEVLDGDFSTVIDELVDLESLYESMGWREMAINSSQRRKQCEAAALVTLEVGDVL